MIMIIIFLMGISIGSFLNVCIFRIPAHKSIIHPGSFCPHCLKPIPFYYNIPLVSYLILRGKCANCDLKIPIQYPLVEWLGGVLSVLTYLKFGLSPLFFFYMIFIYFLIVIAFIDFHTGMIFNRVIVIQFLAGLIFNLVFKVIPWKDATLGLLIGGGTLFLFALLGKTLFHKESMGMGDVKLAAIAGFYLGFKSILIALYLAFFLALIIIILLKYIKKQPSITHIPMGPFFAAALILFIYCGDSIINWYLKLIF